MSAPHASARVAHRVCRDGIGTDKVQDPDSPEADGQGMGCVGGNVQDQSDAAWMALTTGEYPYCPVGLWPGVGSAGAGSPGESPP